MVEADFNLWLEAHLAAFPGIKPWGKRMGNWDAIRNCWRRVMEDVEVADAMRVTEDLAKGDTALRKGCGFGDHAREVRGLCKNISLRRQQYTRRSIDGQPTYSCPDCEDGVYVDVFHPDAMAEAAAGTIERNWCREVDRALCVRCDCPGSMKNQNDYVPRLNRKCMVPLNRGSIDDAFDRLEAFIAEWKFRQGLF